MKILRRPRLFYSLFGSFFLTALVPLVLLGIITYRNYSMALQKEICEKLIGISDGRAEAFRSNLEFLSSFITERASGPTMVSAFEKFVASSKAIGGHGQTGQSLYAQYHPVFQRYFDSNKDLVDMLLISREGKILFSMHCDSLLGVSVQGEPLKATPLAALFDSVCRTLATKVSEFAWYPPSNQPAIFIGAPVIRNSQLLGVFVLRVKPELIYALSSDYTGLGATGEIALAKLSHDTVTYIAPLRFQSDAAFKRIIKAGPDVPPPMWKALHGETGIGLTRDYRKKEVLARWQYVPGLQCGMVVKEDTDEVFAPLRNLGRTALLLGLIMTFGIFVVVLFVTRSIVSPIATLRNQSEAIGKGELGREIHVKANNEIGDLARAFNTMRKELREFRLEMEKKVQEKTRELASALEDAEATKRAILNLMDDMEQASSDMRKLIRAVEQNPASIVITDKNGRIEYVNPTFEQVTGYSQQEAFGQNPRILKSGYHSAAFYKDLWDTITAGAQWRGEMCNRKKNDEIYWESVSISPVKDAVGVVTHYVAVKEDISGRKQMEAKLVESEQRFRTLFENSPDAFLIMEMYEHGRISACNKAAEVMLRGSKERIVGKSAAEISPERQPDGRLSSEAVEAMIQECLARGKNDFEWVYRRLDGEDFWAHVTISVIIIENRQVLLVCWRDISDSKRQQAALQESEQKLLSSNKELEQFAYVASHDLQEPLRVVVSYLQFLESQYAEKLDEKGRGFIARTVGATKRMQAMIRSLLSYSRIATQGSPFENCDTNLIVNEAMEDLREAINGKNGIVTVNDLPHVLGDKDQIRRLFINLIGNALKFCETQPLIGITARLESPHVIFAVTDNGIGIEREYFERIFVIFQRLHSREKYEGTGIGLSACRKIVERHGGTIWLESEPGKGSTFYFTLKSLS
jgi:PAS domain S-box-containing protein